jgi:cholesterol transport system auxiliary component
MRNIYFLVSLFFLFTACSTTVPAVVKYKISSDLELQSVKDSECRDKSVKVSSALSASSLMSKDMSYVQGKTKVYEYSESAWLNNPNRSVSLEIIKMLRDLDIYKSVQDSSSRSRSDLIVESTLDEFMQYYDEELNSSYVVVRINISVIDAKTSQVLSQKSFHSKERSQSLDAHGGVDALNIALKDVLQKSSEWFVQECR